MDNNRLKTEICEDDVSDLLQAIEIASTLFMSQLQSRGRKNRDKVECVTASLLRGKGSKQEVIFAREVFAEKCRRGHTIQSIARYLNSGDHASVCGYLRNFEYDYKYVPSFRAFTDEVDRVLNELQNHDQPGE